MPRKPAGPTAKSRSEINRQNYLRHKAARQEKARTRMREVRQGWRQAIAAWDEAHTWTEPPTDWQATGLSQWAVESALADPSNWLVDDDEEV